MTLIIVKTCMTSLPVRSLYCVADVNWERVGRARKWEENEGLSFFPLPPYPLQFLPQVVRASSKFICIDFSSIYSYSL